MCLQYSSPLQPSSDEEDIERQSPPLEVSDGETDGVDPGPGIMHSETGQWKQRDFPVLCAEQLLHCHDNKESTSRTAMLVFYPTAKASLSLTPCTLVFWNFCDHNCVCISNTISSCTPTFYGPAYSGFFPAFDISILTSISRWEKQGKKLKELILKNAELCLLST